MGELLVEMALGQKSRNIPDVITIPIIFSTYLNENRIKHYAGLL